ncbi:cupin domain-containing protein [Paenibacillus arenilitoris]|uniref:Cupin domain-containing protein n=1 Tax=Paenibacillus arenilitoris TaxID=2772299 RepID=A0A927CNV6_9BACL|nr:cupin domain-containing protein [Paenibacillus arenilitoris]MBD2869020.1 cupin domain-containing protein [Paenibacillus arenilitoris]
MHPKTSYDHRGHNPMQCNWNNKWSYDWNLHYYHWNNRSYNPYYGDMTLQDYGTRPFVVNIDRATKQNNNYRTALWTGKYFQVTLMSINVGEDIGLEVHPTTDQFIRIEEGQGFVQMGDRRDYLDFQAMAYDDYAIMIPAGKWHNITNTGNRPLKVYVIYAPPEHPYGTVHETKAIAQGTRQVNLALE